VSAISTARLPLATCPLCGGAGFRPVAVVESHPVVRCRGCDLQLTNPQPSDAELAAIYGPDYVLAADDSPAHAVIVRSKRATADHYLDLLAAAGAPRSGRLLEVGCGAGNFLLQATRRGFDVTGIEYSPYACARARQTLGGVGRVLQGEIDVVAGEAGAFDVVVLCDVIEHVRHPGDFLAKVRATLKPGGLVLIVTPSTASWSARVMGRRWMELKPEHLFYFSPATLSRQLAESAFTGIALYPGIKLLSLDYVAAHFEKYPVAGIRALLRLLRALVPSGWRERPVRMVASGIIALARRPATP
jgi:SAM-dependent methyltransferase